MSTKTKSIADQIADLQQENENLKSLQKLFNIACKEVLGYDLKQLQKIIHSFENSEEKATN